MTKDQNLKLHDIDISTLQIPPKSLLIGKSLLESTLRQQFGITVVAIRRDSRVISNPAAETELQASDILYVIGSPIQISEAYTFISTVE